VNKSVMEMISEATAAAKARDQEDALRYGQAINQLMQAGPSLNRSEAARKLHVLLEIDDISTLSLDSIAVWRIYHGQS
jgi:hypothetical protein